MSDMVHAGNAIIVSDHFVVIRDDEYVEAVLLALRDFDPEEVYAAYRGDSRMIPAVVDYSLAEAYAQHESQRRVIPDFVDYLVAEKYARRLEFGYLTIHPNVAGEASWMRWGSG